MHSHFPDNIRSLRAVYLRILAVLSGRLGFVPCRLLGLSMYMWFPHTYAHTCGSRQSYIISKTTSWLALMLESRALVRPRAHKAGIRKDHHSVPPYKAVWSLYQLCYKCISKWIQFSPYFFRWEMYYHKSVYKVTLEAHIIMWKWIMKCALSAN